MFILEDEPALIFVNHDCIVKESKGSLMKTVARMLSICQSISVLNFIVYPKYANKFATILIAL